MATSDPVQVIEAWAAAWTNHDIEKLASLFTEDCIYEDVTLGVVNRGKQELRAFAEGVFATMPDFRLELTSRFVADKWAAMEWVMSGTPVADASPFAATGKSFSAVRAVTIIELEGGKIRRNSDYWDGVMVMRQMGQLPAA
ncbi:MAG: ester cyclase [Acidobacteria bacterium]|nr:ester cyclase [Acidobacteriota bacterium]